MPTKTEIPDHIARITKAVTTGIIEGYHAVRMPDGTYRVYLPEQKAKEKHVAYYTVDLMDARTPCTCIAGQYGRRCKHLSIVEAVEKLMRRTREAVHV